MKIRKFQLCTTKNGQKVPIVGMGRGNARLVIKLCTVPHLLIVRITRLVILRTLGHPA